MQVMYRASVVERNPPAPPWGTYDEFDKPLRWNIPVLFRNRDDAIRAACIAAKRKIEQHGGEWSIDIQHEKVVII